MDFKSIRNKLIKFFSNVAEIIKENKYIALFSLAFLVVVAAALIITHLLVMNKREETIAEVSTESVEDESGYDITDEPLEEDAYPEINALMKKYYQASANGDVDTIKSIKSDIDDKESIVIQKKSEYIEDYSVVKCYTKKGPVEDSFLVFVYYEVKLVGFEERAPGLNAWYVERNDKGEYYINDEEQEEKVAEYCKIISVQDDVVDLNNTVNVKFNEVLASNEEFAEFIQNLPGVLTSEVGEELAKIDAEENTEDVSEQETEVEVDSNTKKTVKAITVVNVRSSDSEEADKIGKAMEDQEFQLLEEKVNGWSKILFDGKEAFVKTEYLEVVKEEKTESDSTQDDADTAAAAADSPSSGSATTTDTINMRKEPGTDAEKISVIYSGEKVEVLEKRADGWSKIKYNKKTGYVKSEFLD
ncbi:MAG: SH3 domain-containing protein [Lachnospiraceae bacterium]|nr:SH3 domain-containing protein [Lachnospiraceae bacterium]